MTHETHDREGRTGMTVNLDNIAHCCCARFDQGARRSTLPGYEDYCEVCGALMHLEDKRAEELARVVSAWAERRRLTREQLHQALEQITTHNTSDTLLSGGTIEDWRRAAEQAEAQA